MEPDFDRGNGAFWCYERQRSGFGRWHCEQRDQLHCSPEYHEFISHFRSGWNIHHDFRNQLRLKPGHKHRDFQRDWRNSNKLGSQFHHRTGSEWSHDGECSCDRFRRSQQRSQFHGVANPEHHEFISHFRSGWNIHHDFRNQLRLKPGHEYCDIQRDSGNTDELERDEHRRTGAERSHYGKRDRDGWGNCEQRRGIHGGRAAKYCEFEPEFGDGGNLRDDYGEQFWCDTGHEHGDIQRGGGNADELEHDYHRRDGADRSYSGKCRSYGEWHSQRRN